MPSNIGIPENTGLNKRKLLNAQPVCWLPLGHRVEFFKADLNLIGAAAVVASLALVLAQLIAIDRGRRRRRQLSKRRQTRFFMARQVCRLRLTVRLAARNIGTQTVIVGARAGADWTSATPAVKVEFRLFGRELGWHQTLARH